ncbi:DMT family transporter [Sanguibacter keddieii]|nr:SMR family transporter [Sanguibacter keddieii]
MMWLALVGAILSEVTATLSLRASEGLRKKPWVVPLAVFYPLAFVLLTVSLDAGMAIGVAYGIWAASGVALTAVGARVAFGDPLTRRMMLGIACIGVGVILIELGATH